MILIINNQLSIINFNNIKKEGFRKGGFMSLVVHKYGGTSVGSIEKIRKVAQRVIERKKEGNDMVVVLSAMSGETDRLIRLAQEVTEPPIPGVG